MRNANQRNPWQAGQALSIVLAGLILALLPVDAAFAQELPTETWNLRICSDGIEWHACPDDDTPADAPVLEPTFDPASRFPPCAFNAQGVQITACEEGPDLVVRGLALTPTDPQVGDAVDVRVWVENAGTEPVVASQLRVTVVRPDGTTVGGPGLIGALSVGESRWESVFRTFGPMAGVYQVEAEADSGLEIDEISEINNTRSTSIPVGSSGGGGGADLRVLRITPNIEHPLAGETIDVAVTVDNAGAIAVPESMLRFWHVEPGGSSTTYQEAMLPSLAPGEATTVFHAIEDAAAGIHDVGIDLDVEYQITETDEHNNALGVYVEVQTPAQLCSPCLAPPVAALPDNALPGTETCFAHQAAQPNIGDKWVCFGLRPDGTTCDPDGLSLDGWVRVADRCRDPSRLPHHRMWEDRCGTPDICPGTWVLPF